MYKAKIIFGILFFFVQFKASAQLFNNGAEIYIQNNAYVFIQGNVDNLSNGTINNNGKLEVQGNFTNDANYVSISAEDSLIISGNGNNTLKTGASTINYLTINKSDNSKSVTLNSTLVLNKKLDFLLGTFTTDPINNPSYMVSSPVSAVYNFVGDREIIGKVQRTGWVNGNSVAFNQTNMLVSTNSGTAPTNFTVLMIPQTAGGDPSLTEREVKRSFKFSYTGGNSFASDIRFPYLDGELNTNGEATLIPWQLISSEWNGKTNLNTRNSTVNYVATTGINTVDLNNEWKLADAQYTLNAQVLLRGSWNGSSAMTTTLNSAGILPLSQPYNAAPFNYSGTESVPSIPNVNVVDWVLVELRKPSSGAGEDALSSTVIGRKAGFLLSNGNVVETDGTTPIQVDINKQGASFMVIRHRNHLAVMSKQIPSNSSGTFANDFRSLINVFEVVDAPSTPMTLLAGSPIRYGLWAGDVNQNGIINGTDVSVLKSAIANSVSGYLPTDVNLSNSINGTDLSLLKSTIGESASGTTPNRQILTIKNNIPDIIIE